MAKKTDKPVYAFVRRGNGLFPEMDYDLAALEGIQQGQRVKLDIRQWRNMDRLKAYWATLQDCIDATGCSPSKEALEEAAKVAEAIVAPKSIGRDHGRHHMAGAQSAARAIRTLMSKDGE